MVDDSFGFDDVAFARQSRSRLFFFDEEEEGEETTTGVLDSIVIHRIHRRIYVGRGDGGAGRRVHGHEGKQI